MAGIVIYSIVGCPHCLAAKKRLTEENLQYVDVSVDRFPDHVRDWVRNKTGKTSVPQIFFNGRHIGGNKELQELFDEEEKKQETLGLLSLDPVSEEDLPPVPHPSEILDTSNSEPGFVCENDELAEIAKKIATSDLLQTHRKGVFTSVPNSFTGASLLTFLENEAGEAGVVAQQLLDTHLVSGLGREVEVVPSSLYTLAHMLPGQGLNSGTMAQCKVREADTMARDLRKVILQMFASFLSPDGKRVDYDGMAASETWSTFILMATQLQRVDLTNISDDHKLAFFINIYNVLVIHGTVEKGVPDGLLKRYKFFANTCYNIGGHLLSLNDIENGILRSNRSSMATLYRTPFASSDPRLSLALPNADPRIHFALNCGAKSCPPIKTFTGDEVQKQLDLATQSYLEGDDALVIDVENKQLKLSQLFKWYAVDFGSNKEEIVAWILDNLVEPEKKKKLEELVDAGGYKVSYLHYDWGHNAKE